MRNIALDLEFREVDFKYGQQRIDNQITAVSAGSYPYLA
jgi:hypothetical protein